MPTNEDIAKAHVLALVLRADIDSLNKVQEGPLNYQTTIKRINRTRRRIFKLLDEYNLEEPTL